MISLFPETGRARSLRVLCLGAHCDDIEIGCGGTLLRLKAWDPQVEIRWHVLTSNADREAETRAAAVAFGVLSDGQRRGENGEGEGGSGLRIDAFRDGFLPYEGAKVKEAVMEARGDYDPDVIFTHYREDRHQDHRMVSELTWNAYRDHLILEYEIPKWDGDLGAPNFFVPLDRETADRKLGILEKVFVSQHEKPSFDLEAFRGLMALRGVESRAPQGRAEAFYARKLVLDPTDL